MEPKQSTPILFTRQRHEAKRAGLHWDYRMVVGDKAYSWATKKELPAPGQKIILFEQPIHTADYALSPKVIIPDGQYGAGVTTLDWVKKGDAKYDPSGELTLDLSNGERFFLKPMPSYGEKAWLFHNITPQEKKAYYTRHKYKEALSLEDVPPLKNPVASVKHDGSHFFMQVEPDGQVRLFSRRQSVKGDFPERTSQLPHLTTIKRPELAGGVYSVELIHTGPEKDGAEVHADLSGILNSKPEKAIQTQERTGPVRGVLLDVIHPQIPTYQEKLDHLDGVEKVFGTPDVLWRVKTVSTPEEIKALHEKTLSQGDEGVIVTDALLPEEENVRYKVKNFKTFNVRVKGKTQEVDIKGNAKPSAGAVIVEDATGREVGKVGTGFTHEERRDIWNNYDTNWHHKVIQVKAFQSNKGNLRHPVYNGEADGDVDTLP